VQSFSDALGEFLQLINRGLQVLFVGLTFGRSACFLFQLHESLLGAVHARLELFAFQVAILVGVDQARDAASNLSQQAVDMLLRAAGLHARAVQATLVLLMHALRISQ